MCPLPKHPKKSSKNHSKYCPKTFPGDGAAPATALAHWFNQISQNNFKLFFISDKNIKVFIQEQPKTFPGDGAAQATASAHWFNQIPACFKNYFSKKGKTISWYIFLGPPKVVFLLWSTRKVFCLWSLKRKNKRFENTFSSFFSFEGPRALFLFSSGFNFTNITCQLTRTKHLLSWY